MVGVKNHVCPETHGLGGFLIFDDYGLSPYLELKDIYESDDDETLGSFEVLGETWRVQRATNWEGNIAPPNSRNPENGLGEYSYSVVAEDQIGDKDCNFQFRPGFPDTNHIDDNVPIQSIPDDCPESIRIQVQSTNIAHDDILVLLRAFAEHIGLNYEYFCDPHEWSRVYRIERYLRLLRQIYEDHIVDGGILGQLADVMSDQRGAGEYRWDNQKIIGHHEKVVSDADTWTMLLPMDVFRGISVKGYHPLYPRGETSDDDPLVDPKIEASRSSEYGSNEAIPWNQVDDVIEELDTALLNTLYWAGVPVTADADVWTRCDDYFAVDERRENVELRSNPLPDLRETIIEHTEAELVRTDLSSTEKELLTVLSDSGSMHYETLAEECNAGSTTVYRLLNDLRSLLRSDNGVFHFADEVTRKRVQGFIDRVRETADWACKSIEKVAAEEQLFQSEDGPFQQWMERHGVRLVEEQPDLEFKIDRPVSDIEIKQLLRAGLDAAEASSISTKRFEEGYVTWKGLDDTEYRGRQIVVSGKILGQGVLRSLL